jgi:hypothetical protein
VWSTAYSCGPFCIEQPQKIMCGSEQTPRRYCSAGVLFQLFMHNPAIVLIGQSRVGDSKLFCLEVSQKKSFPPFRRLGFWYRHVKNVPMYRFAKTSNAEMKRMASSTSTELTDKTMWNTRLVIDLLSRAITIRNRVANSYLFWALLLVRFWRIVRF